MGFNLAFLFPVLFRHVLQPSDDGYGIRLIAVIHKVRAGVLYGIVGQGFRVYDVIVGLLASNL